MSRQAARTRLLLEGRILPTILKLSTPNLLYLAAMLGLIAFDGLVISRLGADTLAGVALVFPFIMGILHLSGSGIGGAVTSSVSRAIGAGDARRANALVSHALLLAVCIAAAAMLVMLPFGKMIYTQMGARGHALEIAMEYSALIFSGVITMCLFNILASVVRATGNMLLPALLQASLVAAYVLIAPLAIFGIGTTPGFGVAGGAIVLLIAFGVGAICLLVYIYRGRALVRLRLSGTRFEWQYFAEFIRVGVPGILNVATNNLAVVFVTVIAGRFGRDTQIVYALASRLEYIVIPIAFVFGMTLVAMVGTNWGARQYARARRISWTGGALAFISCVFAGFLIATMPEIWMDPVTVGPEIVKLGSIYLLVVGPTYALFAFGQALYFARQGLGRPLPAVLANVVRFAISTGGTLIAIQFFGTQSTVLFGMIAFGFIVYASLNAVILLRTNDPVPE
jgi:putative MATE family efflux protein